MLQIMPSTRVLGLMKLLMRNAICLRLLSPLPIAPRSTASPRSLLVFPQGLVIGGNGKEGDTSKKMMSF